MQDEILVMVLHQFQDYGINSVCGLVVDTEHFCNKANGLNEVIMYVTFCKELFLSLFPQVLQT